MQKIRMAFLALFIGTGSLALGQRPYKQALSLELAGKSILFASISYEYYFEDNRFGIGGGLGFTNIERGDIIRELDGIPETGRYTDFVIPVLIYGIGSFGSGPHRLHTQLGINWQQRAYLNRFPSGNNNFYESGLLPYLGVGYEYRGESVFFRALPMVGYIGDSNGFLPRIAPWLGLTVGIPL